MNPRTLSERWRAEAERYERDGAFAQAATLRRVSDDLESAFREHDLERLTVRQAAVESGYSEDHLRQLVRDGKIPDDRPDGSQAEIHIRRCDLPRKPARALSPIDELAARRLG